MTRRKLVAATRNRGKIRELRDLLGDLPFELCGLDDFPPVDDVEETGDTFVANAELKAAAYARHFGELTLSDDSGLAVDALGGAPGVLSARYAGESASDAERISKLLSELANASHRGARFVCAIAVADPEGGILHRVEGFCEGSIAFEPRGDRGFGYDPVFIPEGFDRTFGELDDAVKSRVSHRVVATAQIIRFLKEFYQTRT
ncbi:MAG: RdgB/HAM1 family non-canonical purine NTP pyrophosphatase [Acidobacteria bacterium]|nr:RdgB/HAM1 family non-canonical purine NTP pyrophosphatase [Acidobacteriota bacterium]